MTATVDAPHLDTGSPRPLRRVLIANRGEIAVRVIRACRDLGIEAVVVYSEADRDSLAVELADRAVCVGPPAAAASYLNQEAIIAAAAGLGADAVHPGYGFLAENATFAEACEREGLRFIGPTAEAIELMGNKLAARRLADSLGVPVVPGSPEPVSEADAPAVAEAAGYPVILKAAAGGGGRGMRLARDRDELKAILGSASAEAKSAFGDGSIYVERYIGRARHIEVQVLFDGYGNGIHLGERDCTIQRRYQKLIEEAPSGLDPSVRDVMTEAALRLCRHVGYRGVGTVEFIYDQDTGAPYFIEMNTRLQVEHPVTELVTGIDLVAAQLRVAAGERLWLDQADVAVRGHAIEFRLNAEEPAANFRPGAGRLDAWSPPAGPGVRVDTHVRPGYTIPPYYDSLLAKVCVHGSDRPNALARARRALAELEVRGVPTTLPFHRWILEQADFMTNETSTAWAEQTWTPGA